MKVFFIFFSLLFSQAVFSQPEMVCLEATKAAHVSYLDDLHKSLMTKGTTNSRIVEARKKFNSYALMEQQALETYFAKQKLSGEFGVDEEKLLRLFLNINLNQFKFFACELVKTPGIKRGDLLERGMSFCKNILATSGPGSQCLD